MNWELNIPKILHVYWSATPLPYLRYLTVKSFMEYNPDWEIKLWLPKFPYKVVTWKTNELNYELKGITDYFLALKALPITINYVDFDLFKKFGMSNDISEVHKSDWLRYWMIWKYGGLYSDMDIIYFRALTNLKVNTIENKEIENYVCISPKYGHSAGFYMGQKGSALFGAMMKKADLKRAQYQCLGPDAMNTHFPNLDSIRKITTVEDFGMEAVYAHDGVNIPVIYNGGHLKFTKKSIGIHWYGGHPASGKFLRETNGGVNKKEYTGSIITECYAL